ncbi:MAG: Ig-like domain repeat protein [Actinomycetota bacterium]|nr:MAG: Ig-like domain repeat protein [Actinomycetota bacterium]
MRVPARRAAWIAATAGLLTAGLAMTAPPAFAAGTVTGCVTDKAGAPAVDVTVGVFTAVEALPDNPQHPGVDYQKLGVDIFADSTQAPSVAWPQTNAAGCFSISLPAGSYEFAFLDFVTRATPRYGLGWYGGGATGTGSDATVVAWQPERIDATAVTVADNGTVSLGTARLQDPVTLSGTISGRLAGLPRQYAGVAVYTDVHKVVTNSLRYPPYLTSDAGGNYAIGGFPVADANGAPLQYVLRYYDTRHGWPTDFVYGPGGGVQTELDNVNGPFLAFDDHGTTDPFDDTWVAGVSRLTFSTTPVDIDFTLPAVPTFITAFGANGTTATPGSPVTVSAHVERADQGAGDATSSPAGTVAFYDNGSLLTTQEVHLGTAAITITKLAAGAHAITARYLGQINQSYQFTSDEYAPSAMSSAVVVNGTAVAAQVGQDSKTAALPLLKSTAKKGKVKAGKKITLTVIVNRYGGGVATGKVTFKDGKKVLKKNVKIKHGKAAIKVKLKKGKHVISVGYSGDGTTLSGAAKLTIKAT